MSLFQVGIVGYGKMGQHHAKAFSFTGEAEILAVVDPVESLRRQAYTAYGCATFTSIEDMFAQIKELDIVVIATHSPLHHKQTLAALFAGCHVLCEKPMADSLQECDDMVNVARLRGLKLAIHHQSVFSRAYATARQMIVEREIGEAYLFRAFGKGRFAGSDAKEIGGHLAHGIYCLAGGKVTEVYGDVTYQGRPITYEDARPILELCPDGRDSGIGAGDRMIGHWKFNNGIRAEIQLALVDNSPLTYNEDRSRSFGYYIEVFGTKGRLQWYLPHTLLRNHSPSDDWAKGRTPWEEVNPDFSNDKDPHLTQLFIKNFLYAIKKDREPLVSGREGRIAMEMILGISRSHLTGMPLAIPLGDRRHPFER